MRHLSAQGKKVGLLKVREQRGPEGWGLSPGVGAEHAAGCSGDEASLEGGSNRHRDGPCFECHLAAAAQVCRTRDRQLFPADAAPLMPRLAALLHATPPLPPRCTCSAPGLRSTYWRRCPPLPGASACWTEQRSTARAGSPCWWTSPPPCRWEGRTPPRLGAACMPSPLQPCRSACAKLGGTAPGRLADRQLVPRSVLQRARRGVDVFVGGRYGLGSKDFTPAM